MLILFLYIGIIWHGLFCGCYGEKWCLCINPEDGGGMFAETLGTQLTSTCWQHLKTDLTPFPVRKLTWQPYRLWYTSNIKLSCENNVWGLPKNDWIWLEIRYLHDTSLIWCQVEEWQRMNQYACVFFRTQEVGESRHELEVHKAAWKIWGSHSGDAEDSCLLECYNWYIVTNFKDHPSKTYATIYQSAWYNMAQNLKFRYKK